MAKKKKKTKGKGFFLSGLFKRAIEKKVISGMIKKYGPKAVEVLKPLLAEAIKGSIQAMVEEKMRNR